MKTKPQTAKASLKRRIRQFYKFLNEQDFAHCHAMIDPRVRHNPKSITLLQYSTAATEFLNRCGSLKVIELHIDLHLRESSTLYEGRDFAIGKTTCEDARGQRYLFSERWVREGRSWYSRCTGFVTPAKAAG